MIDSALFSEHYSTFEESNLQDNTIYQSKSFLIPAIEFFTFHSDRSGKKSATFYRTSTKLPDVHPVRFDSIKKWFDSLIKPVRQSLFLYWSSDCVCCRRSESAVHGITFTHDNVPYALATMKQVSARCASLYKSILVRRCQRATVRHSFVNWMVVNAVSSTYCILRPAHFHRCHHGLILQRTYSSGTIVLNFPIQADDM
jgi:hypothetical protein